MANKKVRQLINYVLPLSNCSGGHRLGVNGLAIDSDLSILYSGGRDGSICAWDLNLDLKRKINFDKSSTHSCESQKNTKFRAQIEAHTHWVNDIVLTNSNTALVSASSDLTVKVWRPFSDEQSVSQKIGQHSDYVKCLATPNPQADWVASGGLDRIIRIWDLNGSGKKLEIEAWDEEKIEKGSVYALATRQNILASGGPDSIVRLWDPRSGSRITKFVGHTDNIRDILISKTGDTIFTASSDQTIKVWSVTACRCMHTLTMHNESVWSLHSNDLELGTIYSSDRSGLVVRTDFRGSSGDIDNGISLAIAQENEGVNKLIVCGDFIWTATSSSSINRWLNVGNAYTHPSSEGSLNIKNEFLKQGILAQPKLGTSNVSTFSPISQDDDNHSMNLSKINARDGSLVSVTDQSLLVPIHISPQETIQGYHGLVKHKILNDRRRVLTLGTAGDVILWDLLCCVPIKSFGKRHLEDVEPEVNTLEAIASWCSVDTRTGRLTVILEENNCFDAELYVDELDLEVEESREDQRINIGKWILRYMFSNLLEEIIRKDEIFREKLLESRDAIHSHSSVFTKPRSPLFENGDYSNDFLRNTIQSPVSPSQLPGLPEDETVLDNKIPFTNHEFGDCVMRGSISAETNTKISPFSCETRCNEKQTLPLHESEKENSKEGNSFFGKKFRKGMSFGSRKNRSVSSAEKLVPIDEKIVDGSETSENGDKEQEHDDNFGGVIKRIRMEYQKSLQENPKGHLESKITPSQSNETPLLKLPPMTTVIIQEETSGGFVDLYRGTVATIGKDAQLIEERGPAWLGELLLRNKVPSKEPVKVSFILQPWNDLLPSIAGSDRNSRLNANRMLRVKKILAYVAERIEFIPEVPNFKKLKPEEYLEIYCSDQKLPVSMTLATLRAHIWKGGADVLLFYKCRLPKSTLVEEKVDEASCDSMR